jgi:hypothetical protein
VYVCLCVCACVYVYGCVYVYIYVNASARLYLNNTMILSHHLHNIIICTHTAVRATPIANGKPLVDRSQGNEFKFYRFVCQEKQKMIRITVKTTKTENLDNFRSSDCMDMYVTNAYHGLVAVGKENYVWKSGSSSVCNIDIHPTDKQVRTETYKFIYIFTFFLYLSIIISSCSLLFTFFFFNSNYYVTIFFFSLFLLFPVFQRWNICDWSYRVKRI